MICLWLHERACSEVLHVPVLVAISVLVLDQAIRLVPFLRVGTTLTSKDK
jgi:hypothetical protein